MKSFAIKWLLLAPVILMLSFIINSCKQKGCTDKAALNYSIVADKNDGSCIYCKASQAQIGSPSVAVIDENPSSPFFDQQVAKFIFDQESFNYNDQKCGTNRCTISYSIQSMVNQSMDISYTIEGFGNIEISATGFATVGPNQTLNKGQIDSTSVVNACQPIDDSTSNINILLNQNINYH